MHNIKTRFLLLNPRLRTIQSSGLRRHVRHQAVWIRRWDIFQARGGGVDGVGGFEESGKGGDGGAGGGDDDTADAGVGLSVCGFEDSESVADGGLDDFGVFVGVGGVGTVCGLGRGDVDDECYVFEGGGEGGGGEEVGDDGEGEIGWLGRSASVTLSVEDRKTHCLESLQNLILTNEFRFCLAANHGTDIVALLESFAKNGETHVS